MLRRELKRLGSLRIRDGAGPRSPRMRRLCKAAMLANLDGYDFGKARDPYGALGHWYRRRRLAPK
jgi:hypothetical protein